jgi:hypothetical protein
VFKSKTEIIPAILATIRGIDYLNRADQRRLLIDLCELYASANFGFDDGPTILTLDEADCVMAFIDKLVGMDSRLSGFGHHTIEQMFRKDAKQTPAERCKHIAYIDGRGEAWGVAAKTGSLLFCLYRRGKKAEFWRAVNEEANRHLVDADKVPLEAKAA